MRQHSSLKILTVLTLLASSTGIADSPTPRDASQRPQLENYENPDKFVQELLAWERQQRQSDNNSARTDRPSKQRDWHDITGPETLEGALRRARGYTPPDYEAQYRFNRTTHLSFPLPRLEGEQMSGQAITGGLRDQALDQRSLDPLPEMRVILEEAGDEDELTVPDRRSFLPVRTGTRQQTVQVNAR